LRLHRTGISTHHFCSGRASVFAAPTVRADVVSSGYATSETKSDRRIDSWRSADHRVGDFCCDPLWWHRIKSCLDGDPHTGSRDFYTSTHDHARTIDTHAYTVDTHAYTVDTHAYTVDTHAYTVDTRAYTIDARAYTVDTRAYTVDTRAYTIDAQPNTTDATSRPGPRSRDCGARVRAGLVGPYGGAAGRHSTRGAGMD
jgi:hypothetical protein